MIIIQYVRLARIRHWPKNLMVFLPAFLSGALSQPGMFDKGILPFIAFCLASSAIYIFNDSCDLLLDVNNPRKKYRPLASGAISKRNANVLLSIMLVSSLTLSLNVSYMFTSYVVLYLFVSIIYSVWLKHVPIVDVFCIAFGFVFRLFGGGEAFGISVSEWLFLSVFLIAIFLSVGKRFSEQRTLGALAVNQRSALEGYPDGFLESAMYLSGGAVLIAYSLYVISVPILVYTVPICMFILLRYLLKIKSGADGDPVEALLSDSMLLTSSMFWFLFVGIILYI